MSPVVEEIVARLGLETAEHVADIQERITLVTANDVAEGDDSEGPIAIALACAMQIEIALGFLQHRRGWSPERVDEMRTWLARMGRMHAEERVPHANAVAAAADARRGKGPSA